MVNHVHGNSIIIVYRMSIQKKPKEKRNSFRFVIHPLRSGIENENRDIGLKTEIEETLGIWLKIEKYEE